MELKEAETIYLSHVERTEKLIDSMGDNPQKINAFITNTYATLLHNEPAFLWFELGAIVSTTVGKNIQTAIQGNIYPAGQAGPANIALNAFAMGNQAIFKDIVPLFLTYQEIGLEGITLLENSILVDSFRKPWVSNAFKGFAELQTAQKEIAQSLNLSLENLNVISNLFSDEKYLEQAHKIAMNIANQEQKTVQDIYDDDFLAVMLDPALGLIGHAAKLDEIRILDQSFPFFDYIDNPADIDQRLKFAEVLLNAIEEGIRNGEFERLQHEVINHANHSLWMANPNAASHTLGDINGAYWGQQADLCDQEIKNQVIAFINNEMNPTTLQETVIPPFIDNHDQNISSIFSGMHEIVKINVDPLDYFLVNNPNYEVIAKDISELWASTNYLRAPINGGTALWNPQIPYLNNSTYIALYNDGEYHYYQPHGEVRGITFPFIFDKNTGVPLTMPMLDAAGHYDHASTIDTIYNHPEAFNTPTHINWYNPYWDQVLSQAQLQAAQHYFKSITIDNFMNAVLQPSSLQFQLSSNDIFHQEPANINFSSTNEPIVNTFSQLGKISIISMELANGMLFEVNSAGNFDCVNCNNMMKEHMENAANTILHSL